MENNKSVFLYDANEVMRIIGYQNCCKYLNSDFRAALDAHKAAKSDDNSIMNIAIDFYLLGICCGKRLERSQRQRKRYKPLIDAQQPKSK